LTVTCHFAAASSHRQLVTWWDNLINRSAEYFLATPSRYALISDAGAYSADQLGLGSKEYWYECAILSYQVPSRRPGGRNSC
jgi:hypothetical protein